VNRCRICSKTKARKRREEQKASLIQQGVAEVPRYLWRLKQDDEITAEEYWDSDFTANLIDAVRRGLGTDLTGEESTNEVRELAREIIEGELE